MNMSCSCWSWWVSLETHGDLQEKKPSKSWDPKMAKSVVSSYAMNGHEITTRLVSNLVWFLISREKSRCVDVSHCFTMFYCCHLQPIVSAQNNSIRMLADAGGLTQSPPNIQDVRRQKMSIGRCFEAFFNIFQCQLRLIRPFLRNGGSPAAERWGRGGIVGRGLDDVGVGKPLSWVNWNDCTETSLF